MHQDAFIVQSRPNDLRLYTRRLTHIYAQPYTYIRVGANDCSHQKIAIGLRRSNALSKELGLQLIDSLAEVGFELFVVTQEIGTPVSKRRIKVGFIELT